MNPALQGALALVLLLPSACNYGERRRLRQELGSLQQRYAALSHDLLRRQNGMRQMEDRARGRKIDLALHNTETLAYIDQHQLPVGCIRAVRASFGQGSVYAQQVTNLTKLAAVACTVAMFSQPFAQEVHGAERRLEEADVRAKGMKAEITALETQVEKERTSLLADRKAVDRLAQEIADLQQRIDAL